MKKIKIKFGQMWGNFNEQDNFILDILKEKYEVELSDQPEYYFYSGYSADLYKYPCIRIFYSFENFVPDFNLCDYAIAFDDIQMQDRYCRFPLYLNGKFTYYPGDNYQADLDLALQKHHFSKEDLQSKEGFCSYVVSNGKNQKRNKIFEKLNEYKTVASGGRYKNNVGGPVQDKLEFAKRYKFSICFENSVGYGYTTEKLMQAFAAQTIPIYYGNPAIEKEFNKNAFINLANYSSFDEAIEDIKKIDNDDDLYVKMMQEPAFAKDFSIEAERQKLKDFIFHIIDQDYEKAFRRQNGDYQRGYEKKYKISSRFYCFLLTVNQIIFPMKKMVRRWKTKRM